MRPVHALIGLLCAQAATVLGCAWWTRPDNKVAPGHAGAPNEKRFLLCAPNTVVALPAELQGVTGALRQQIDAYLHYHDRETQWMNLVDSRQYWSEAAAAAKKNGGVEKAPVFLAAVLDETYDFDAIVMPSLLVHKVRATDGGAVWNGVSRQMEIVNKPSRLRTEPRGSEGQDTFADGVRYGGITGDVLVTSIHLLVYTRTGERIFEGRGGLAFVYDVDMANARNWSWKYRLRDLAADVDALREGIAIAFDPYLPEAD